MPRYIVPAQNFKTPSEQDVFAPYAMTMTAQEKGNKIKFSLNNLINQQIRKIARAGALAKTLSSTSQTPACPHPQKLQWCDC